MELDILCPCCSNFLYMQCCQPLHDGSPHDGQVALTPLALMRSRYAAYALNLPTYIQKTTHPKSPYFENNRMHWMQTIAEFCQTTEFIKLEILDVGDHWVSFAAHLKQKAKSFILSEKSYFEKIDSQWYYTFGNIVLQ